MGIAEFNAKIIKEFRDNEGVVGGRFSGANLLLLRSIGAKSGIERTTPLAYFTDAAVGDDLLIIASFSGADTHPPWYFNLLAQPQVTVEVGVDEYKSTAREVDEPLRSEIYGRIAKASDAFAQYQSKTTRVIPVIQLTRNA